MKKLALLVVIGSILMAPLYAGISVAPVVVETKAARGKSASGIVKVKNNFEHPVDVNIQTENWREYKRIGREVNVDSWLDVTQDKLKINPGEVSIVNYTINMPEDIKGELMAMMFFASLSPEKSAVSIGTRFGVAVYAASEGTEVLKGIIQELKVEKTKRKKESGYVFLADVKNEGNTHIRPRGKVIISNKKGKVIDEVGFNYGWPLFPDKDHVYDAFWILEKLKKGSYTANAVFTYGDLYSDTDKTFEKSIDFRIDE